MNSFITHHAAKPTRWHVECQSDSVIENNAGLLSSNDLPLLSLNDQNRMILCGRRLFLKEKSF